MSESLYRHWERHLSFPSTGQAPLGFGAELWNPSACPQTLTSSSQKYEYTSLLLPDVIASAGAIEYTCAKLEGILDEVGDWVHRFVPEDRPSVEFGYGVAHPALLHAYYEFNTLLFWIRCLRDRLSRKDPDGVRRGLLPALADGKLRDRVSSLVSELRGALLDDARFLANYSLHYSMLPHPRASNADLASDGRLILRIPDRMNEPIPNQQGLSYSQGRTVAGFSRQAFEIVASFVDKLLIAFEENMPARLKKDSLKRGEVRELD